ncbi:class I SAM-dependent methyltransferase [Phaeacidiphilus oryzae]|uniref:class I SAM-dependent methyltransferase n=1 Tax=Phaeacidiphilus oryzae TaxID=348818 RepID=UPI000563BBEF|nr:class I SAM-dependent methyltransferase [Phaeacidiphilus oryzae]
MPTTSSEGSTGKYPSGAEPHKARETAEGFGANAARYDRTRPGYPQRLIARITAAADTSADGGRPTVLDVGCGTGIASRLLQSAGCRVLGVEPDARMAEFARARGTEVEVSTIEEWDPAGRRFDAVVAGQAWHWVDPVAGAARAAEALRRPAGRLVVFWNVFRASEEVQQAFTAAYRRTLTGLPEGFQALPGADVYQRMVDIAANGIRESGAFEEPQEWRHDWEREYTRDEWLDQVPTFGGFNRFPPEQLDALLAAVGEAVDAMGGSFTLGYTAAAVAARVAGD